MPYNRCTIYSCRHLAFVGYPGRLVSIIVSAALRASEPALPMWLRLDNLRCIPDDCFTIVQHAGTKSLMPTPPLPPKTHLDKRSMQVRYPMGIIRVPISLYCIVTVPGREIFRLHSDFVGGDSHRVILVCETLRSGISRGLGCGR